MYLVQSLVQVKLRIISMNSIPFIYRNALFHWEAMFGRALQLVPIHDFKPCVIFCSVALFSLPHCRFVPQSMYCCFTSGSYFCFEKRAAGKKHLPATINNGLAGKSHRKQMKNVIVFSASRKRSFIVSNDSFGFLKTFMYICTQSFTTMERTFEVMEFIGNLHHQTEDSNANSACNKCERNNQRRYINRKCEMGMKLNRMQYHIENGIVQTFNSIIRRTNIQTSV